MPTERSRGAAAKLNVQPSLQQSLSFFGALPPGGLASLCLGWEKLERLQGLWVKKKKKDDDE